MVIKDKILLLLFFSNHGVYVVFKDLEVIFYMLYVYYNGNDSL